MISLSLALPGKLERVQDVKAPTSNTPQYFTKSLMVKWRQGQDDPLQMQP